MAGSVLRVIIISFLLNCCASIGQAENSAFVKIKNTEKITVGYRNDLMPLSYVNQQNEPVGYSIDVCRKIVEKIKAELNLPALTMNFILLSAASRLPSVANGTVDLDCTTESIGSERSEQIGFSLPVYMSATRAIWKKKRGLHSFDDLKGKRVSAVAGTSSIALLTERNFRQRLSMIVLPTSNYDQAFKLLESEEVDGLVGADFVLFGFLDLPKHKSDYSLSQDSLLPRTRGITLRKDEPELKQRVDRAIMDMAKSGELKTLYTKWFQSPIPPNNTTLDIPMSEEMKQLISREYREKSEDKK